MAEVTHAGGNKAQLIDINRRSFLYGAAALSAGGIVNSVLPGKAWAGGPRKGGILKAGLQGGGTTDSLDPASYTGQVQFHLSRVWGDYLLRIKADGSLANLVAEEVKPSADAKTWTVKIRKGIEFHNGKTLTPDDVVATVERHAGPGSKSAIVGMLGGIASMKTDGDEVVFGLKEPNADFPYLMSDYHLSIFPAREGGGIDWQGGIGTGAFKLESFEPGIAIRLKRNPDYHKPGLPHFDEIEVVNIPDGTARLNALMTGEVDVIEDVDIRNVAMVERNDRLKIVRTPSLRHLTFDMNCSVAPYDNPAVRKALKLAIDRDDIIAKVFLGEAKKGNDNPAASIMPFYAETPPQHAYDPDAAKAILKEAGLDNVSVDLSVAETAFPGAVDAAVLFKEHAAKAGITVNIVQEADDGYWDNVWLKKPFNASDWYGRVTLDWLFATSYTSDAPWNNTGFKKPAFDALVKSARAEMDQAKRAKIYAEAQQMLHDEGGLITVAFVSWRLAMTTNIGHATLGGILPADNHRGAERWWRMDA